MRPMLATQGPASRGSSGVPRGAEWAHEIKWDGIRLIARVRAGELRLTTRSERDVTVAFPELAGLTDLGHDLVLDGEAVTFVDGVPSFSQLVERVHTTSAAKARLLASSRPTTYLAFDLLGLDGLDLTSLPWSARRAALEEILPDRARWQVSPQYADGQDLFRATAEQGLEGVVSKRVTSTYQQGVRSPDWLKFPHRATESVVIGGWRPETGRARLGSVLVGAPVANGLTFRGRVGSGLAGRAGARLAELIAELPVGPCPFVEEVPRLDREGATWVEPSLVVDVASLGTTPGGRLRQPAYKGWRSDLTPEDLTAGGTTPVGEAPASADGTEA
ncbi:non-homologous end-joining DNA ligase [Ornithinimicrobium sp. F0845]|uniref:non-homologous end-joining DNA ligase n=1 Tax=Ornithinimicrobium sp. F0845 TaxID=2926412 RepID=UPI001FF488F8|nr:non-homologous end-joining DNA ligase [Ornithinimicrobium sp. F0845]MCK0113709.1 non-homologous end-joining DNA ligase [Ornithinimicrobium sp. F0845]